MIRKLIALATLCLLGAQCLAQSGVEDEFTVGDIRVEGLQRISEGLSGSVAALRQTYDAEFSDEIARLTLANERRRAELAAGIAAAERTAATARHRREQVAVLRGGTSVALQASKES